MQVPLSPCSQDLMYRKGLGAKTSPRSPYGMILLKHVLAVPINHFYPVTRPTNSNRKEAPFEFVYVRRVSLRSRHGFVTHIDLVNPSTHSKDFEGYVVCSFTKMLLSQVI